MTESLAAAAQNLEAFSDADSALARLCEIYDSGTADLRDRFDRFLAGKAVEPDSWPCYPYLGMEIGLAGASAESGGLSYGKLQGAGAFGATLTRPGSVPGLLPRATGASARQLRQAGLGRRASTGQSR